MFQDFLMWFQQDVQPFLEGLLFQAKEQPVSASIFVILVLLLLLVIWMFLAELSRSRPQNTGEEAEEVEVPGSKRRGFRWVEPSTLFGFSSVFLFLGRVGKAAEVVLVAIASINEVVAKMAKGLARRAASLPEAIQNFREKTKESRRVFDAIALIGLLLFLGLSWVVIALARGQLNGVAGTIGFAAGLVGGGLILVYVAMLVVGVFGKLLKNIFLPLGMWFNLQAERLQSEREQQAIEILETELLSSTTESVMDSENGHYPAKRAVWLLLNEQDYGKYKEYEDKKKILEGLGRKVEKPNVDPVFVGQLIEVREGNYQLYLGKGENWFRFEYPETPTEVGKLLLIKAIKSAWINQDQENNAEARSKALLELDGLESHASKNALDELIRRDWGEGTVFNWTNLDWKVVDNLGPYFSAVEGNTHLSGREFVKLVTLVSRDKGEEEFSSDLSLIIVAEPLEGRRHMLSKVALWSNGKEVSYQEVQPWIKTKIQVSSKRLQNAMEKAMRI